MKGVMLACLLAMCLMFSACHGIQVPVHPGSINTFDSVTADTLTSIKATIDGARTNIANGTLPASLKGPVNNMITAYNTADAGYLAWRNAVTNNQDSSALLTQAQAALAGLTQALTAYTAAGGK